MHSVVAVILVASFAYVGTMFDNFFAFAAQLVITDRRHYRRIAWAQALGILTLLVIASGVGSLLAPIPTRWIGLLCVAPWALALHAWRHREEPAREQFRRGALTTFTVTLALGGDNLAVWIPLLRAHGAAVGVATVAIFIVWECLFIFCAQALTSHPRVVAWGTKYGTVLVPWVYLGLGVLILVECGTFT